MRPPSMTWLLALAVLAAPVGAQWDRFVEVARKVEPSVVTVKALRGPNRQALGSGVIYRADGYIVTTADVVRGVKEVEVVQIRPDGDSRQEISHSGKVVGVDEVTGIAVVKVTARDLPAATFGDSDRTEKGAWVMVMGNSLGLASSLSLGVVSNRDVLEGGLLQLSAPVNPGNSGAPVFNEQGEVVGVVVTTARAGGRMSITVPPRGVGDLRNELERLYFYKPEGGANPRAWQDLVRSATQAGRLGVEVGRAVVDRVGKQLLAPLSPEQRVEVEMEWQEVRKQLDEAEKELQVELKEAEEELTEAEEEAAEARREIEREMMVAIRAGTPEAMGEKRQAVVAVQPTETLRELQQTLAALRRLSEDGVAGMAVLSDLGGMVQGLNFAVPGNTVKKVADQLIEHGKVVRGHLGVVIEAVPEELRTQLTLKEGEGVLISQVKEGSPASKSGLQAWDVVLTFAGKPVGSPGRLRELVSNAKPGEGVEVEVVRGGERLRLNVAPGEAPAGAVAPVRWAEEPALLRTPRLPERPWMGVAVDAQLSPALKRHFGLEYGLVIRRVFEDSPADKAGLRVGEVLLEIDGTRLESEGQLRQYLATKTKPGQQVELLVLRAGERQVVKVEIEARKGLAESLYLQGRPGPTAMPNLMSGYALDQGL